MSDMGFRYLMELREIFPEEMDETVFRAVESTIVSYNKAIKDAVTETKITYSHRNGETEPPTIDEAWYWFDGGLNDIEHPRGVLYIFDGATYADGEMWSISELKGRWWGPVTPPWGDDA